MGINPYSLGFLNLRHKTLTVLAPTCKSSEALSQAGEGALFCPTAIANGSPFNPVGSPYVFQQPEPRLQDTLRRE